MVAFDWEEIKGQFVITIKNYRKHRIREWFGLKLLRLGAWIYGFAGVCVEHESDQLKDDDALPDPPPPDVDC